MRLSFVFGKVCRGLATLFTLPMAPAPAGTLGAAIGEAVERFPQDRIVREARALAEIEVRAILGLRPFDA